MCSFQEPTLKSALRGFVNPIHEEKVRLDRHLQGQLTLPSPFSMAPALNRSSSTASAPRPGDETPVEKTGPFIGPMVGEPYGGDIVPIPFPDSSKGEAALPMVGEPYGDAMARTPVPATMRLQRAYVPQEERQRQAMMMSMPMPEERPATASEPPATGLGSTIGGIAARPQRRARSQVPPIGGDVARIVRG